MTHSFLVTIVGVGSPDAGAIEAILDALTVLIASGGGASVAGEPADDGVDTAGDAMSLIVELRLKTMKTTSSTRKRLVKYH